MLLKPTPLHQALRLTAHPVTIHLLLRCCHSEHRGRGNPRRRQKITGAKRKSSWDVKLWHVVKVVYTTFQNSAEFIAITANVGVLLGLNFLLLALHFAPNA